MGTRLRVFPAALILASGLFAARPALAGDEGHFDRTLTVSGAVDLSVQTGSGSIHVRAGEAGKVQVHGEIRANGWLHGDVETRVRELEANPPIEQNGNTIRIGYLQDREKYRHISVSYELVVPAQTSVHSESGSGEQSAEGVSGPIDATSGSGELKFSNIGGEVRAHTGSGDIDLNSIRSNAHVRTGSGSIQAIGIAGGLEAATGSGDVKLEQTGAGDVQVSSGSGEVELRGVKGGVRATTGSGKIHAQGEPAGEWRLHTGSGDVVVELPKGAAFELQARTSSGQIESEREVAVQGRLSPRELHGKVGGGGALIDLSTSSGSIYIR